jgi:hypothetical protein
MSVDRPPALGLLDGLVGEWTELVTGHGDPTGTVTFEWSLEERYLIWRTVLPPPFPESLAVVEYAEDAGEFRVHYFDARGVTRIYRMTFTGSEWTMLRAEPDFSPLGFSQRFVGSVSDDGRAVDGRWEQSHDGGQTWEHDFAMRLERGP